MQSFHIAFCVKIYLLVYILYEILYVLVFFFFSSRRRHTRLTCDWSSDVCSSDLTGASRRVDGLPRESRRALRACTSVRVRCGATSQRPRPCALRLPPSRGSPARGRSEERRVGKECRSRGSPDDCRKKEEPGEWGG